MGSSEPGGHSPKEPPPPRPQCFNPGKGEVRHRAARGFPEFLVHPGIFPALLRPRKSNGK